MKLSEISFLLGFILMLAGLLVVPEVVPGKLPTVGTICAAIGFLCSGLYFMRGGEAKVDEAS